MRFVFLIGFFALGAVTIQATIYILTKKKFLLFVLPAVCAIVTIYILLNYGDSTWGSKEAELYFGAFVIGIPAFIASLLTGIIITRLRNK